MKNKRFLTITMALLMASSMSMTSFAGSWQLNENGWWWLNDDGTWIANTWQ